MVVKNESYHLVKSSIAGLQTWLAR